jgi:hypothetical protein
MAGAVAESGGRGDLDGPTGVRSARGASALAGDESPAQGTNHGETAIPC